MTSRIQKLDELCGYEKEACTTTRICGFHKRRMNEEKNNFSLTDQNAFGEKVGSVRFRLIYSNN